MRASDARSLPYLASSGHFVIGTTESIGPGEAAPSIVTDPSDELISLPQYALPSETNTTDDELVEA
jgi:hypothetical protein